MTADDGLPPISCSPPNPDLPSKLEQALFQESFSKMATLHPEMILDQYKLFVETTEKVYEKRQTTNSFFVSLNAGICAVIGYLFAKDADPALRSMAWLLPLFGLILSYYWAMTILSYKQLATGKFKIIDLIEKKLPLALFSAEWSALANGENHNVYQPVTTLEIRIAWVFVVVYAIVLLTFIPWASLLAFIR